MPAPLTPPLHDLIAAWLAAQQAGDIYGLTRRPVLSPPGIPNLIGAGIIPPPVSPPAGPPGAQPPTTAPPAGTQPQIEGGEPDAPGEPPGWGRMDPGMETGLGLLGLVGGLLGSPAAIAPGVFAGLSRMIGDPFEANPYADVPSLAQIEQARARTPQHVPEMMAQRQAVTDALAADAARMQSAAMKTQREGERTGIAPGDWDPGGWDRGIGIDGGGAGPGGQAGDVGAGEGDPGDPSGYARGGVRIFRRPTKITAGEAGREVGIFIPQRMLRPGIQGPERSVLKALETLAKQLRRGKASDKQRNPKGGT